MFQRGDFGGRIGIGLSIHSVYIGASYGGGFLNIAQEDDTSKFRNRSWSLSVGYDFNPSVFLFHYRKSVSGPRPGVPKQT